jgi:hypothetical protein
VAKAGLIAVTPRKVQAVSLQKFSDNGFLILENSLARSAHTE